ncbi:MAG: hypothetical protein QS721_10835 [Candidatus Endonucleobacter sp. (ex Gigantidas childressi)]|nr:hypothetical protein [Candidatus Endonucleobacter sp. (ex Gigantidas childressi)]
MANSCVVYPSSGVLRGILVLLLVAFIVGCSSTSPPSKPSNLCSIFKEKPGWYKAAKKSQKRWGTPVQIMMAIMYQESSFRHDAQPPRPWFLFIPLPRKSSAYGYAQAQDPVWGEYCEDAAGWFASRDSFSDAIDFIGWYNSKSRKANGVSLWQADLLYLNYHEGWGGYRRGTWKSKHWLKKVAKKVKWRASEYGAQLQDCNL